MAKIPFLLKLAAGILAVAIVFFLVALGDLEVKELVIRGIDALRTAGPAAFFACMAILPAAGVPMSLFTLTAGSAFGPQLGMPVVVLVSLAAIAANVALGYALAIRALRPPLQLLMKHLGYGLPQARSDDVIDLIVLLRVTPGIPFPAQNYLLGLAGIPFVPYLLFSCLIAFPLNAAIIIFGEALLQGRGRIVLIGLLLLAAFAAITHLLRRHLRARPRSR